MVGKAATILWLEVIFLPSNGTLKSTLMKTRLSFKSKSWTDNFDDKDIVLYLLQKVDNYFLDDLWKEEIKKTEKELKYI